MFHCIRGFLSGSIGSLLYDRFYVIILSYRSISCNRILVVLSLNLEVALWVVADWANLWSLLTYYDMTAVRALPDAIAVSREYELVLYVLQELAITLLVVLLDFSHHLKLSSNLLEAFLVSFLCHAWIHIGPLVVLTISCSFEILLSILDSTALQVLEP